MLCSENLVLRNETILVLYWKMRRTEKREHFLHSLDKLKNFFAVLGVVLGENHRGTSRFLICPLISPENGHLCLKTPVFPPSTVF